MSTKIKSSVDELSPKWASFLDAYIKNGNAYQSALTAGFSEEYAKVITSRYPEKVIKSLKEALEEKGVTSSRIAEKINVLLEATKPVFVKDRETGETEQVDETPDYQAIDKGIAHATKIYGIVDESEKPKGNTTYNFIFSKEVQDDVKIIEERIKQRLINGSHVEPT